jgi:hypothetical protein
MVIWGIVLEKATILHWLFGAIAAASLKALYAWIGSKFKRENFHLRAEVIGRQIVVETFREMPFALTDKAGEPIENVYVIAVRFWNQGKRPLLAENVSPDAPLRIRFEQDVKILEASAARSEELMQVSLTNIESGLYEVSFDCLNADEWIELCFFATGNARSPIDISGRLFGQKKAFSVTNKENDAGWPERVGAFFVAAMVLGGVVAMIVASTVITLRYNWMEFLSANFDRPVTIYPWWVETSFVWGACIFMVIGMIWGHEKVQRRKHPADYPDASHRRPTERQNLKAALTTALRGKKRVVSASLYDYGQIVSPASESLSATSEGSPQP